jgi:lipopolysaccharide/colanic/teichoic acid biosynthesis glycosyltransferase
MVIEWCMAVVLLILLAPLIGLLALLVKWTSPGPAFYHQVRLGYRGRHYRIHKLRTMTHNCEAVTGPVWSTGAGDPRVTRFGRLLRDTHLDELPQLWNVLCGEMSLVGPRPERPEIAVDLQQAMPNYTRRLQVRPGVTGLAQVQLPPDVNLESVRHKLAYDLHYVREVSPVLDMRIIIATGLHFTAVAIKAVGEFLVRPERTVVEARGVGEMQVAATDGWRVGAA